jgi:hypothetical protein
MQRRIFPLLFLIAGVLLFQSVQAQTRFSPPNNYTVPTGTYNSNINVNTPNVNTTDLTINLTLQSGVTVNSPGGNAVNAANTTNNTTPPSAFVVINADGVTINNTLNPSGNNLSGLRIQSSGAATITATNTNIDVDGITGNTNNGIWAIVQGSNAPPLPPVNATVTWTGDHITSSGANSTGIQAENRGFGNASVDASGNISVSVGTSGALHTPWHKGRSRFHGDWKFWPDG